MPFFVYILYSEKADKYYIGHSENMEDRLVRHNSGRSKATKAGLPWTLVYAEQFETRSHAYQREMQIKSWKSKKIIFELIEKAKGHPRT